MQPISIQLDKRTMKWKLKTEVDKFQALCNRFRHSRKYLYLIFYQNNVNPLNNNAKFQNNNMKKMLREQSMSFEYLHI